MSVNGFLSVQELCRYFGGQKAVDGVSFEIAEGSLAAIIGPNGAGKTTLFNLIAGALLPTRGQVLFRARSIRSPNEACARGIARTFQNVRLFPDLSVLENVMVGLGGGGIMQGLLRLPRWVDADRLRMKQAYYLLDNLGISHLAEHRSGEIPFGQQRLVEMARALALRPKLLLLDEPAAGLNATETTRLGHLIRRIQADGITLLLVEHDMSLVMNLAERILVLDRGHLIADGAPDAVRSNPAVRAAYLGTEENESRPGQDTPSALGNVQTA
jgi:ABC-type branched-subunit amino acid transport system ATPase component